MTIPLMLFILFAVLLVLLLAWTVRPPSRLPLTPEQAFQALSEERHYARLPQILQSLREEDTEFIRNRGHKLLLERLCTERKQIALHYLGCLEEEFRILLECSRILATLAPELDAPSDSTGSARIYCLRGIAGACNLDYNLGTSSVSSRTWPAPSRFSWKQPPRGSASGR